MERRRDARANLFLFEWEVVWLPPTQAIAVGLQHWHEDQVQDEHGE